MGLMDYFFGSSYEEREAEAEYWEGVRHHIQMSKDLNAELGHDEYPETRDGLSWDDIPEEFR